MTYTVPPERITPENITQPLPHQVSGFGSNEGGQHSKGAALTAKGWAHAQENPQDEFLMTAIGCGLAGYRAGQIAPLFRQCVTMPNVRLPASFWVALGYSVTR
jgi:hypothetical protein